MSEPFRFSGFSSPTYTQVPDEFFDVLAPQLTENELRVLIYIIRRTFGFKKSQDDISLNQLVRVHGRCAGYASGIVGHGWSRKESRDAEAEDVPGPVER